MSRGLRLRRRALKVSWASAIPDVEWKSYSEAIGAVRTAGIPFLLGGGFASATYTGRWRDTKDIDIYVRPEHRDAAAAALGKAGFADYYERLPYDRRWIYRSVRSNVIVDVIWAMANQRAQVDDLWFERARMVTIRGQSLRVLPLEEFIWCKLYILQRDRCDWVDILNLLYGAASQLDWDHLVARVADDLPLLQALLTIYGWLCPERAAELPAGLRRWLHLVPGPKPCRSWEERVRLLDSRAWFAALRPRGQKLEI